MPTLRSDILIAHRWLWRALKKGEWLWLMLAIVIAASSVTLVKQLSETVQQSMLRQAANALGADLVLRSTRPVENHWRAQAEKLGLQTSQTTTLVTMALTQDAQQEAHFQLVQLKAVENNFPLRGTLQHSDALPF
ncbi:MAG: ABC transporter permease, partial [Gammaproteobacteria bacterium]|nr:ABC transporter permease [Gammaproteobacteria bacterium]